MSTAVRSLGWGIFCTCSWTWCIGMFLPVVLVERFGWTGFLVFAIPNVIGCTAVGYLVGRRRAAAADVPSDSAALVRDHLPAMRWFSRITIAYHAFFAAMIGYVIWPETAADGPGGVIAGLSGGAVAGTGLLLAVLGGGALVRLLPLALWPLLAIGVYLFSINAFMALGTSPLAQIGWTGEGAQAMPTAEILWLAPVITIGFICCPWLDLTLHRARRVSGTPHTFAVFGATFVIMILLTCAYALSIREQLATVVLAHLVAQSVFTVGAHWRELDATSRAPGRTIHDAMLVLGCLVAGAVVGLTAFAENRLDAAIDWYLRFLVFYGLVFPVYICWFMLRPRTTGPSSNRRGVIAMALAIGVALPMFEAGFIHQIVWLPAPVLVAIIAIGLLRPRNVAQHGPPNLAD